FIASPYRTVKHRRVLDYVQVVFRGESHLTVGESGEKEVVERENRRVDAAGKRPGLFEPHSFYQTAWEAEEYTIAQANVELDESDQMVQERVNARKAGNFVLVPREDVQFIDVSPKQRARVAASLSPGP